MIIQRLFSKLGGMKRGLKVNKSATGFANKKLAAKGYRAAKETATNTGKDVNIITGKDGSYYTQKHYRHQSRKGTVPPKPKAERQELDGFRRGETRGPRKDDPTLNPPKHKVNRKPWVRSEHREKDVPGKNTRIKIDYTNGSGRVKKDSPIIPKLLDK